MHYILLLYTPCEAFVRIEKCFTHKVYACIIQWNLSNPDTIGADKSVLNSEVVKYTNVAFGTDESVLFIEVSLIQRCPYSEVPL